MTLVGRSHTQRAPAPRPIAAPAWPLRDLTDTELSEQFDTDLEAADALLHGFLSPHVMGDPDPERPASTSPPAPGPTIRLTGLGASGNHNNTPRRAA